MHPFPPRVSLPRQGLSSFCKSIIQISLMRPKQFSITSANKALGEQTHCIP